MAILSQCGKTLPYKRKKRAIAGNYSVESQTIAFRTVLLLRMCINCGLNVVEKNHEYCSTEAAQRYLQDSRDVPRKNGTFFKTKVKRAVISRTGISRDEAEYTVDSGASMQIASRNDCIVEEHDTIRKSKESGTIISAWCVSVFAWLPGSLAQKASLFGLPHVGSRVGWPMLAPRPSCAHKQMRRRHIFEEFTDSPQVRFLDTPRTLFTEAAGSDPQ